MILPQGIHDGIPASVYHADPCEEPSLSASIASVLDARSPAHAWANHPRLNPVHAPKFEPRFDKGAAAHALILEGEDRMEVCHFDDWRKKDAQQMRDAVRADGRYPVLAKTYDDIRRMRDAFLVAFQSNTDLRNVNLGAGKPEQTMVWKQDGIWFRARPDWLDNDHDVIFDYKTTEGAATAGAWTKALLGTGKDVQEAFYRMGLTAIAGKREPQFIFAVQEDEYPYGVNFFGLDPVFQHLAEAKVARAKALWRRCLTTGQWPGYPPRVCWLTAPQWAVNAFEQGSTGEDGPQGIEYDPAELYRDARTGGAAGEG